MIRKFVKATLHKSKAKTADVYNQPFNTYTDEEIEIALSVRSSNTNNQNDVITDTIMYTGITTNDNMRIGDTLTIDGLTYTVMAKANTHRYVVLTLRREDIASGRL